MAQGLHPDADILYDGVRIRLLKAELHDAQGQPHPREIAETADAVVILPLLADSSVVMIRNQRFAVNQTLWELPAGTVEPGEDHALCAARELREETGYAAGQLEYLTQFFPSPGFCTETLYLYRATELTHVGQDLDDTENITVHTISYDQALQMVQDRIVQDGKTIAGLLHHHAFGR